MFEFQPDLNEGRYEGKIMLYNKRNYKDDHIEDGDADAEDLEGGNENDDIEDDGNEPDLNVVDVGIEAKLETNKTTEAVNTTVNSKLQGRKSSEE